EHLQSRAINCVANSLAQSAEHVRSFFQLLKSELAFYVGCINLRDRLVELGAPMCLPDALPETELALSASGLYDIGLCLRSGQAVVGNDLQADGKALVVITGANQGGKSTFLRSLGLAQIMMQAGMFVPAFRLRANLCGGVFTHFKREEDATMTRGKFDDELQRVSDIADMVTSRGLLLCNEPFASTNEREGSEIAREVLRAFTDAQVKVVLVTHMFELAHGLYMEGGAGTLSLRAERLADGTRTFRLLEAAPLATSYGEDSYRRIFSQMGPQVGGVVYATPAVTGPR
ncbi:MAG: MutS-related protein, partial [Acidimicrobiales bacterium]